jgi:phospholipid N-methyltransferase
MAEWIDWPEVNAVVEYGPGTGVFTGRILSAVKPGARFFGIEINSVFCESLTRTFPTVHFHNGSVENVEAFCRLEGIETVDAVLSGLPWAFFSSEDQARYLEAMFRVLRPGGQFVTFTYLQSLILPAGRQFKKTLIEHFSTVEYSPIVWRNLPPAFVYRCRR